MSVRRGQLRSYRGLVAAILASVVLTLAAGAGIAAAPPPLRPLWRTNLADNEFFLQYSPLEMAGPADSGDGK